MLSDILITKLSEGSLDLSDSRDQGAQIPISFDTSRGPTHKSIMGTDTKHLKSQPTGSDPIGSLMQDESMDDPKELQLVYWSFCQVICNLKRFSRIAGTNICTT